MSLRSRNRNRAAGYCGGANMTCFPEALDILTPEAAVSAYTYQQYARTMRIWERPSADLNPNTHNAIYSRLFELIARDLGGYALSDYCFERALTAPRLERILDCLIDEDFRPAIDIISRVGDVHSLGVKQIDAGLYRLVGNGIPAPLRGAVTAREIEPFLHHPGGRPTHNRWPFLGANISALPAPEPGYWRLVA